MSKQDLTYEEAFEKLKSILEILEKDDSTLNDSMKKFKEGVKLYNYCNSLLSKAEGEITLVVENDLNNIEEVDFPMEV